MMALLLLAGTLGLSVYCIFRFNYLLKQDILRDLSDNPPQRDPFP